MKLRILAVIAAVALFIAPVVRCQSDSMIHVNQFPGSTVGAKVGNAMQWCPTAPVPCILVIDASLATATTGTMPTLCGNCFLDDYRNGPPSGSLNPNTVISKLSPMADIRANGAVIDGATDIGPALATSISQCNSANGNSCTVLLPCTGPNGCFWANGSDGVTLASGVTLILQGILHLQTSLVTGNHAVNIIGGDGGYDGVQFGAPNQIGQISVNSAANGVLGTAVTVTPNSSSNFGVAQTFTPSTMTGLYAGTWITVAAPTTCAISTISRTSNVVSATLSASCHIPPGVPLTVAGVTDPSFNGAYSGTSNFVANSSDYVQNTMGWLQTAANSSSTGGTVTGLNEDSVENVQITSCTTNTCTATFYRSHSAADVWGVDGVALDAGPTGSMAQLLQNITIRAPGTLLDAGGFNSEIKYVSGSAQGQCSNAYYSFAVSVVASSFLRFDSDTFDGICAPYSMHVWNQYNYRFATAGGLYVNNSFFIRGFKLDHGAGDMVVKNSTCDQCYAAISFDPNWFWNGNVNTIALEHVEFNDNTVGFSPVGYYQLYPVGTAGDSPFGVSHVEEKGLLGSIKASVNDYAPQNSNTAGSAGSLKTDVSLPSSLLTPRGIAGTYNDGRVIDGEIRSANANFAPAIVPFATQNVPINGTGWSGGCTVTTGVMAPDGTSNAVGLTQNIGAFETIYSLTGLTPAVGDVVLFGGWVYSPTHGVAPIGSGSGYSIFVDSNSSTHFSFNNYVSGGDAQAGGNDSGIINDWYHPTVGIAIITASDGTSAQTVRLEGSCDSIKSIDYFDPWMMYVPASANIPLAEVERWRTQLMHGYVPPSAVAGNLYGDNAMALKTPTTIFTGTSGTATCTQSFQGTMKIASCSLSSYAQTGTAQTYSFPTSFTIAPAVIENTGSCGSFNPVVIAGSIQLPANASMTPETCSIVAFGQ